ncbi:hypothetical protein KC19_10G122800 [Ceratodon purpureus]|uniref:Dirigent protein n=1 Tax=Ceratodon purpureus TaxID=3225 RepID=A0A8T0GN65_CERPU|nr:hypothetical protein KC19_10G122800 [Ceratodon purpureus]KAG0559679.1 hypothetical protein KC19_10G122800 [Ceratodon purpureus]
MARSSVTLTYITIMLLCICCLAPPAMAKKNLHLTYYGFETRAGPNTTLLLAAGAGQSNISEMGFGSIFVFDNVLRTGSTNTSKVVGHNRGTAVATSVEPIFTTGGLYMTADHIFGEGSKYNGSRLTVIGTVADAYPPYTLLIPGGLGYFFGCSGYASSNPVPATPPLYVFKWDFYLKCK